MDSLIDQTYFVRSILIPGVEKPLVSQPLCTYINEYQDQYLKKALGIPFYRLFEDGLMDEEKRFVDIVNGRYYGNKEWEGLRNVSLKRSIIADYVYFYWNATHATSSTVIGESVPESKNSRRTSPKQKMTDAWNRAVTGTLNLWQFLRQSGDYPEFDMCQVSREHFKHVNMFGL